MAEPEKHARDADMSEEAINRRMRKLSELYQFWRSVERSRHGKKPGMVREAPEAYGTEPPP